MAQEGRDRELDDLEIKTNRSRLRQHLKTAE